MQDKICNAIRAGSFFEVACEYAGVAAQTGYEWIRRGEGRHSTRPYNLDYAAFASAVRTAEREGEVALAASWRRAGADDWRAAAEFLARRFPERWSPKLKHELSGPAGGPLVAPVLVYIPANGRDDDRADSTT